MPNEIFTKERTKNKGGSMVKSGHIAGIQFYKLDLFHCYMISILGKFYEGTGIRTAGSSGQKKCRLQIFTEQLSNAIDP